MLSVSAYIHNRKPPLIVVNRLPDLLISENSYTCFHRQSVSSKEKADLIIFDPPYFDKNAGDYSMKLDLLQNSRFDPRHSNSRVDQWALTASAS